MNVSRCYRQLKPSNYFAHHTTCNLTRVIDLCCSTSVNDFATNDVIDMFDFLVFNNCWCVFDSISLTVIFASVFTWNVGLAYMSLRSGEPCILLFEMNEDMASGCDMNPCISVVIFFSSSEEWGGHCPHHQLNRYMLWMPHGWHFLMLWNRCFS